MLCECVCTCKAPSGFSSEVTFVVFRVRKRVEHLRGNLVLDFLGSLALVVQLRDPGVVLFRDLLVPDGRLGASHGPDFLSDGFQEFFLVLAVHDGLQRCLALAGRVQVFVLEDARLDCECRLHMGF